MSPQITINREDGGPIYRQIAEQIRSMIVDGSLQQGTRLPPIRTLANALGVSKLTVFQAYSQLQESGLAEATVGRGTIISDRPSRSAGAEFLGSIERAGPINAYEQVSDAIGLRSLATAVPDPDHFHSDEFLAECYALRKESPWTFYYSPAAGASELLVQATALLRARGIHATEQQVMIAQGGTHARTLILLALCSPGDAVLIDDPATLLDDAQAKALGIRQVRVPLEADGPDLDQLERAADAFHPKLYLTFPTHHPATGVSTSAEKRRAIVRLAEEKGFLVVEFDSYARLAYDAAPPRPMCAPNNERVIYVESFSYSLSPGLRLAMVRAQPKLRDRLTSLLNATGISGPQFIQIGLARFIQSGRFEAHLARSIPRYRARRDALLGSLKFFMPPQTRWTPTQGGLSTWVTLPDAGRYETLYQAALEKGVAFTPGHMLTHREDAYRYLRLCFGTQTPEAIHQAVQILARLVEQRAPK